MCVCLCRCVKLIILGLDAYLNKPLLVIIPLIIQKLNWQAEVTPRGEIIVIIKSVTIGFSISSLLHFSFRRSIFRKWK